MARSGEESDQLGLSAHVRPVAVLDACVLIPAGLRDLLLSCADAKIFRPVWQDEILDEVRRNGTRLLEARNGLSQEAAAKALDHTLGQMNAAFPDASADSAVWVPLVPSMTNDAKDRHVLAVASGIEATHLVTVNLDDFPVESRPPSVAVVHPDRFMLDRFAETPELVVGAVEAMSRRLRNPPATALQLAMQLSEGQFTPQFGESLRARLAGNPVAGGNRDRE